MLEQLLFEEESGGDAEEHNAGIFTELKKNVAAIGGIPESLKSFYSNKIQDVLKVGEGGMAYTQILEWLDDHPDFKALAEKGDMSGIIDKIEPIAKRREKKVFDVMEQDEDLKRRETMKKGVKFDEPLERLLRIINEQINKRAAGPKVLMSDLDVVVMMSLVSAILVTVANLKQ
jgi:hypothetical protein